MTDNVRDIADDGSFECDWQPAKNLDHYKQLLEEFWEAWVIENPGTDRGRENRYVRERLSHASQAKSPGLGQRKPSTWE